MNKSDKLREHRILFHKGQYYPQYLTSYWWSSNIRWRNYEVNAGMSIGIIVFDSFEEAGGWIKGEIAQEHLRAQPDRVVWREKFGTTITEAFGEGNPNHD